MEIYLRLGSLGGNIGEIYHFALGDVSGTPNLGIELTGYMIDLVKQKLVEKKIRPTLFLSLSFLSRKLGKTEKIWRIWAGISEDSSGDLEA